MLVASPQERGARQKAVSKMDERQDFSLVLGGPLFQLLRRMHVSGDALELVRRRIVVIVSIVLAAAPRALSSERTGVGRERGRAFPVRRGSARSISGRTAAVDRRGAGRSPAHASHRAAIPGSQLDSRAGAATVRCGDRLGRFGCATRCSPRCSSSLSSTLSAFCLSGAITLRSHTATWYAMPTAEGLKLSLTGRWYAYVSLPCLPVPVVALVLSDLHLGALSLAGVAHRIEPDSHSPGPRRRPGVSCRCRLRVHARLPWHTGRCWPD